MTRPERHLWTLLLLLCLACGVGLVALGGEKIVSVADVVRGR